MLKKANDGQLITENDLPPIVSVSKVPETQWSTSNVADVTTSKPAPESDSIESDSSQQGVGSQHVTPSDNVATVRPKETVDGRLEKLGNAGSINEVDEGTLNIYAVDKEDHRVLTQRRDQYKQAALQAKKENEVDVAKKYMLVAKVIYCNYIVFIYR